MRNENKLRIDNDARLLADLIYLNYKYSNATIYKYYFNL